MTATAHIPRLNRGHFVAQKSINFQFRRRFDIDSTIISHWKAAIGEEKFTLSFKNHPSIPFPIDNFPPCFKIHPAKLRLQVKSKQLCTIRIENTPIQTIQIRAGFSPGFLTAALVASRRSCCYHYCSCRCCRCCRCCCRCCPPGRVTSARIRSAA